MQRGDRAKNPVLLAAQLFRDTAHIGRIASCKLGQIGDPVGHFGAGGCHQVEEQAFGRRLILGRERRQNVVEMVADDRVGLA